LRGGWFNYVIHERLSSSSSSGIVDTDINKLIRRLIVPGVGRLRVAETSVVRRKLVVAQSEIGSKMNSIRGGRNGGGTRKADVNGEKTKPVVFPFEDELIY